MVCFRYIIINTLHKADNIDNKNKRKDLLHFWLSEPGLH